MRKTLLCLIEVPEDDCAKANAVMGKTKELSGICRFVNIDELLLAYMGAPMNRGYPHNFDDYIRKVVFNREAA